MENIKYYSKNKLLRSYNEEMQFRFSSSHSWIKMGVFNKEFKHLFESKKNEIVYSSNEKIDPIFICFHKILKKELQCIKTKVYLYKSAPAECGGTSLIYFGHKVSGKSAPLKEVIVKISTKVNSNNLIREKHLLDEFLNRSKKLRYIQEPFALFQIESNKKDSDSLPCLKQIGLISKKHYSVEKDKNNFTFFEKITLFYQMLNAADTIISRESLALDIKLDNMLYDKIEKDGKEKLELILIDISPLTVQHIKIFMSSRRLRPEFPTISISPLYNHILDLEFLAFYCGQNNLDTSAEKYFKIGKQMMVYQLGLTFLRLLLGDSFGLLFPKKLFKSLANDSPIRGCALNNDALALRIHYGIKKIKTEENRVLCEKIESLLLKMVVTLEKRISLIEALREVRTWILEEKLCNKKKENLKNIIDMNLDS